MSEWHETLLGDVCQLRRGLSYVAHQLQPPGAPFITIKCFEKGGGFRKEGLKTFSGPIPEEYSVSGGELLVANTDLTRDASIVGAPALVPSLDQPAAFSMDVSILETDPEAAHNPFLGHRLGLSDARAFMQARSGGSTVLHLQTRSVPKFSFLLPPMPEQRKVAEILDTIDEAIRKTEAIITKLKQVKQGLLHDLLTRGIDDNGELRDLDRHPEQFKDSPLGPIPKTWEVMSVEHLLADVTPAMRSGPFGSALLKSELVDEGVPLLGIDNVHVERFVPDFSRFVTPKKAAELARYKVRPRDVMITIMGTVGRCCLVPDDVGHALSTKHVWTLSFDRERYSPLLACLQFSHSHWVLRHFARDEQGGIMSAIRSETLRTAPLPVPPVEEQRTIEDILRAVNERLQAEESAVEKMKLKKHGLSEDLLTGRVRVAALLAKDSAA